MKYFFLNFGLKRLLVGNDYQGQKAKFYYFLYLLRLMEVKITNCKEAGSIGTGISQSLDDLQQYLFLLTEIKEHVA